MADKRKLVKVAVRATDFESFRKTLMDWLGVSSVDEWDEAAAQSPHHTRSGPKKPGQAAASAAAKTKGPGVKTSASAPRTSGVVHQALASATV